MIIPTLLAAVLSLTSPNDYVFTVLTMTNGIHGVGMGESRAYHSIPTVNDIAFLHESLRERVFTAYYSDLTNYPAGGRREYAIETNVTSHAFSIEAMDTLLRHDESLYSTNYIIRVLNVGFNCCTDEKADKFVKGGLHEVDAIKSPDESMLFEDGTDMMAGFEPVVISSTSGTQYLRFNVSTNFHSMYHNVKAVTHVAGVKSCWHANDSSIYNHTTGEYETYTPVSGSTGEFYRKNEGQYDYGDTVHVEAGDNPHTYSEGASLSLTHYHSVSIQDDAFGGLFYVNKTEIEDSANIFFCQFALQRGQSCEAVKAVAFVTAVFTQVLSGDRSGESTIFRKRYTTPIKIKKDKDGKTTLEIDLESIAGEILVKNGMPHPKDAKSMMASVLGGYPEEGSLYGSSNVILWNFTVSINAVGCLYKMNWNARVESDE